MIYTADTRRDNLVYISKSKIKNQTYENSLVQINRNNPNCAKKLISIGKKN